MQLEHYENPEEVLLLKLFNSYHLNVEDRKSLPGGKIRASVIRGIIERSINRYKWFPGEKQKPIGDAGGEYIQIGLEEKKVNLHINYESSYQHFSHMVKEFDSVREAADAFLKEKQKRNDLDGIGIDWDS